AGAPAALDLPADRPRPPVQSFRGATVPLAVPAAVARGLARLAVRQGATPFMAIFAAFAALLGRYTGLDDLLVGSPVANRTHRESEGLIGFFVTLLPLRADLAGDPTLGELLARARVATLGAYAHQELPFERLVEALVPERSLARSPLFQVVLAFQSEPA